ncbi:MAG: hypothetical protein M3P48_09630 [Actinomycetota bacterium]|nr:hypothetical protein [Actinomycetota bacterium]
MVEHEAQERSEQFAPPVAESGGDAGGSGVTPDLPPDVPGGQVPTPEVDFGGESVPDEDVNPDAAVPEPPD